MPVRDQRSGNVIMLDSTDREEELFHELIGALRMNSNLRIGAVDRKFLSFDEASKVMGELIKKGIFHVGTIRTHYRDGTVRLLGAWLYGENNGISSQVAGDMLGHIVGDKTLGYFNLSEFFQDKILDDDDEGI
jgi:hypothetical protein